MGGDLQDKLVAKVAITFLWLSYHQLAKLFPRIIAAFSEISSQKLQL